MDFFFNVTNYDLPLAKRLVYQLNNFYPESQILCITDGEVIDVKQLLDINEDLLIIQGESLKKPGFVGEFSQRNFTYILEFLKSENIIKLDPDSFIRRKFTNVPQEDWCGEINNGTFSFGKSYWARGGCFLIKRNVIKLIVDSYLLLHPRYKILEDFEIRENRIYQDFRVGHVANALDIYPTKWNEVSCEKLNYKDKRSRLKAVVHPVKHLTNYDI